MLRRCVRRLASDEYRKHLRQQLGMTPGDFTTGGSPPTPPEFSVILNSAQARTTGGRRQGMSVGENGFAVELTSPGSPSKNGTNPEQLFACAYSASLLMCLREVYNQQEKDCPSDASVSAKVQLGTTRTEATYGVFGDPPKDGFSIAVHLSVHLRPQDQTPIQLQRLVQEAHNKCPYSHALRGNVVVLVSVNNTYVDLGKDLVNVRYA